jgi:hypothetical protein
MVTLVKDNLLVILMDVAALTQWGSSWGRERTCWRGGIRKNCGNLWKYWEPTFAAKDRPPRNLATANLPAIQLRWRFHKYFEMSTMYADVVGRLRWRARESLRYGWMKG